MSEAESAPSRLEQHARRFWRFLFLSHALGAASAAWMLPGGFPLTHLKFWSNEVCCPLLAVAMACGVWADVQNRREVLGPLAFGAAMLWLVGGLSAAILFPYSMLGKGIFALAAGALAMGLAAWSFQGTRLLARSASLVGFTALGFLLVLAQRGRDPATHPQSLKPLVLRTGITEVPWHWQDPQLGSATIDLQSARVELQREKVRIGIQPLLSFESRSADRGWTLFASPADRIGPARSLCSFGHREDAVRVEYAGVEPARIDVTRQPQVSTFVIKGWVELPQPVYSHLNSFGTVLIQGHVRLELEFSPCPGQWIEPVPNDYPVGRPLRLGTMYQDGVFRVVEATSAEKGPFRTLAEGKLEPGHAVVVTLRDAGKPLVSLCFDDWHTQISTELSPTAGWGMPQNEIMFARHTSDPASVVFLGLTLASTSTGRGYDSVGHAAGVYRNRIRVKWLNGGEAASDR